MKEKIEVNTTFGGSAKEARNGFSLSATVNSDRLTGEMLEVIVREGIASLLYRGGASVLLNTVFDGKKSSEVAWDAAKAGKVASALEEWFAEGCPNKRGEKPKLPDGLPLSVIASEYEVGGSGQPKYSEEKTICGNHESRGDLVEWLAATVKYTGPTHTDDGKEYAVEMLAAVKVYKVAAMKLL